MNISKHYTKEVLKDLILDTFKSDMLIEPEHASDEVYYEALCRAAIAKGASATALFAIPAREKIGRAKSVPAEEYVQVYQQIEAEMEKEIEEVAAQGGEDA